MASRPRDPDPALASTGPFDLTAALNGWRRAASAQPAMDSRTLDELEDHLRDGVERLESTGLTTEEAFLIASRRLGSPEAVGREVARLRPHALWLDRALWALCGVLLWGPIPGLLIPVAMGGVTPFVGSSAVAPALLYFVAQVLGFAVSLALCVWLIADRGPRLADWLDARAHRRWMQMSVALAIGASLVVILLAGRLIYTLMGWSSAFAAGYPFSYPLLQLLQVLCLVGLVLGIVWHRRTVAQP